MGVDIFQSDEARRAQIMSQPFPPEWEPIMAAEVPYDAPLSPDKRALLRKYILVFLAEKKFEGCVGLEMTDTIRVSIAAQACILLLGQPDPTFYPSLKTILIYPHHYVSTGYQQQGGLVLEGEQVRLGESWHRGPVVLSWDDVHAGASDVHDGHNVVFHEFAHQLDDEHGGTDGAPTLPARSMYISWARVLGKEYSQLLDKVERHRRSDIDKYGATNPAEFFAVVTEAYFERPKRLQKKHPELYEQLREFYEQDSPENPPG